MRTLTEIQHTRLDSKHFGDDVRVIGWDDHYSGPILYNPNTDTYGILASGGNLKPSNASYARG